MPFNLIVLLVIAGLIYFGLLHRILDRMKITDTQAFIIIVAMIIGTFIPNIPLGRGFAINIGGGIVPIIISIYLIATSHNFEKARAFLASGVTGGAVYTAGRLLPADPGTMMIEPIIVYAIIAGVISYVIGRSRRCAFISAILGVTISDLLYAFLAPTRPANTVIGGAGVLDTQLLAAVIAVGLCEIAGEALEKLSGGSMAKKHKKAHEASSMLAKKDIGQKDGDNK